MKDKLLTTTTDSCKNHGYQELSSAGQWMEITSGNYGEGYDNNERCYWAFYAPGAIELKIEILYLQVVRSSYLI